MKWRRLLLQRLAGLESVFALSFTVLLIGIVALILGIVLSGPATFPGIGIVLIAAGGYLTSILKPPRDGTGARSWLRALGRGYVHVWHWIRPPRS